MQLFLTEPQPKGLREHHKLSNFFQHTKTQSCIPGGHKQHASIKGHNGCVYRPHLLSEEVLSKNLRKYTASRHSKQIKIATCKLFPKQSRKKEAVWAASHLTLRHTCSKNSVRTELKRNQKSF